MNVLIGCEESGTVRDAFLRRGHRVLSCDLQKSRSEGPHYAGDIFDVIHYPWDLAIFHPSCTDTAVSGAKHFASKWLDGRQAAAVSFFLRLEKETRHIPRRCFEHPVSIMSRWLPKAQIIQPHQFGHPEFKTTCLYLFGLPPLMPTNQLLVPARGTEEWKAWNRVHRMPPGDHRARDRSKTYDGIAHAMAVQWGYLPTECAA
jgi:hypothetical protein